MTPRDAALAAIDAEEVAARDRDAADPLTAWRERFRLPVAADGTPAAYLAGNSLGAQPLAAAEAVAAALERWSRRGVDGWFDADGGWMEADAVPREATARLVGARPAEVATMNTLTVDLHLLLSAFYRPGGRRTRILIDSPTFPSDRYAVDSQLRHHGLDPEAHRIVVGPRDGASTTRIDDLEAAIADAGDTLAIVLLAGVNYATGQRLPIGRLTAAAHAVGAVALWDLAHAAGNVPLALHDDGVDAAAWCTYKYLNSGPGSLGQVFIHERHHADPPARLHGWWGNAEATRFRMAETFDPAPGAMAWRISTPPILSLVPIAASLAMFDDVGLPALRQRSIRLTGELERLLLEHVPGARILTPTDPEARGAQLSVAVPDAMRRLAALEAHGVIGDFREPDILRFAPAPLYNTHHDAWRAVRALVATS